VLVGVPLGLYVGRFALFQRLFSPIIEILRPLCPIAWIPFALAIFKTYTVADVFGVRYTTSIFGHIQLGMLFVIFYGGFFPIFLNTVHGVKSVKNIFIESALLLGASENQLFRKVIVPSALPAILTGLRVGLGISWMVIIAAEMLPGSDAGIGYLIMFSYELAEMHILIASMILIGLVGALLSYLVKLMADQTSFWQAKER
jgi:NitT/TauT family transport system permease protein